MYITALGKLSDQPVVRAGFIGCGSHSFRNIYPAFQFTPIQLEAVCDIQIDKAHAFAQQFGAKRVYGDYHQMLADGQLDAIFVVTNYDEQGRPRYPKIAADCLKAGCHVWIEKPPAASVAELEQLQLQAQQADRLVMTGLKKMFFPINEKAHELMRLPAFGKVQLLLLQYPQSIPTVGELQKYLNEKISTGTVIGFLDHLCHPAALLVYLMGMPESMHYSRSESGAGVVTFNFTCGAVASLALTHGAPANCGMEFTQIIGEHGHRIVMDNNIRLRYDRNPPYAPGTSYGSAPTYFTGNINETSAIWEPEFSLGQLYNKGLFLEGYYGEINAFAMAILEHRPLSKGTLDQAKAVTRIFEGFVHGPGKVIAF